MRTAWLAGVGASICVGCATVPPTPPSALTCEWLGAEVERPPAPELTDRQRSRLRSGEAVALFILVRTVSVNDDAAQVTAEPEGGTMNAAAADLASGGQFLQSEGGVWDTVRLTPLGEARAAGWAVLLTHPGTAYVKFGDGVAGAPSIDHVLHSATYRVDPATAAPAVYLGVATLCVDVQNILFGGWSVKRSRVEEITTDRDAHVPLVAAALWDGASVATTPMEPHNGDLVFTTFEE